MEGLAAMYEPNHPVWNLARLCVLMIALTLILWMTASRFDATELRTIILTFIAAAGVEALSRVLPNKD